MDKINGNNSHQSYNADVRFNNEAPKRNSNSSFMEMFQSSSNHVRTGYDAKNSDSGPAARFHRREDGHVYFEAEHDMNNGQGGKGKDYDLGYFAPGKFNKFGLEANWSNDPNKGFYKVSVNGQQKLNLPGITNYNPGRSDLLPSTKFGNYGTNAYGSTDFANIDIRNLSPNPTGHTPHKYDW